MKKPLSPFVLLTLPLLMAACGQTAAPATSAKPVAAQNIRVHLGPAGKLGAQGLPSGTDFKVALTHLKVKVTAGDGTLVTFKDGVYAPDGDGDTFLTLNAANGFSRDVLLPAGNYTFETIAKDGTDEGSSTGTLLAYSKSESTLLDAGHSVVQLRVHTVMNPAATALGFALPTQNVYTNEAVGLRLNVKTNSVGSGEGAAAYTVPTSDFSVGAYTAVRGTVNAVTASKLGVTFTATGSLADRSAGVSVPVTGWIQDGPETASLGTVTVSFQHEVASGVITADVTPPTATFGEVAGPVEVSRTTTLTGSVQDDGNVGAARLYDGTTLVASSDETEVNEDVQLLSFPEAGNTWTAGFTPAVIGDHSLTLVVDDAAGNETTAEQTLKVVPMDLRDHQAPVINPESVTYSSFGNGQGSFSFTASDNVCVSSATIFMNSQAIGQESSSCYLPFPSTSFHVSTNPGVTLNPGDVVSIVAYDMAGNASAPVSYTIPDATPIIEP